MFVSIRSYNDVGDIAAIRSGARNSLYLLLRKQASFVSYGLIEAGGGSLASVSVNTTFRPPTPFTRSRRTVSCSNASSDPFASHALEDPHTVVRQCARTMKGGLGRTPRKRSQLCYGRNSRPGDISEAS
jgi:hypothetical protein